MAKDNYNKNTPYWFVMVLSLLVSAAIFASAVKTSLIDAHHWNKKADAMLQLDEPMLSPPHRGDIYAHDGTPLAQTVALYTAFVDFSAPGVDEKLYMNIVYPSSSSKSDTLFLDELCGYLAETYPVKTKQEYAEYITAKRKADSNSCILVENITEAQYDELKNLPVFDNCRSGKYTGLTRTRSYKRFYPYEEITLSVLGRATLVTREMLESNAGYKRNEWHGTFGLEKELDELLFGDYGTARKQQEYWGFGLRVDRPALRGYDVVTTLDMNIQEIASRNLMEVVSAEEAEFGTVVVMDVATGEIRAMANVERTENGQYTYRTKRNHAVRALEPGSVVKTLSMILALEKGVFDPDKPFVSKGAMPRAIPNRIEPHRDPLTPREVMILSDNRGICKMIDSLYRDDYNQFIRDARALGIMETCQLPLTDAQQPRMEEFNFTRGSDYYEFAQMVFGYKALLPPVTTLSIYNAIANNGRLMQPKLVNALVRDGVVYKTYEPVCLNERICSPENNQILREMLHEVVYDGEDGTARALRFGRVEIAGKTGTVTAQKDTMVYSKKLDKMVPGEVYDTRERRLAFAGFFPYENPQYSCIVVIDKPNTHSAARVSGSVFTAIAEEMYNRNMLNTVTEFPQIKSDTTPPRYRVTTSSETYLYDVLGQHPAGMEEVTGINLSEYKRTDLVPSVVGLTGRDAIYLLEQLGIVVEVNGMGRVASQSVAAGTKISAGMKMKITLK